MYAVAVQRCLQLCRDVCRYLDMFAAAMLRCLQLYRDDAAVMFTAELCTAQRCEQLRGVVTKGVWFRWRPVELLESVLRWDKCLFQASFFPLFVLILGVGDYTSAHVPAGV